jgi:hypothetical protein
MLPLLLVKLLLGPKRFSSDREPVPWAPAASPPMHSIKPSVLDTESSS